MTPATGPVSGLNSKPCEGSRNRTTNFTYLNHAFTAISHKKDVLSIATLQFIPSKSLESRALNRHVDSVHVLREDIHKDVSSTQDKKSTKTSRWNYPPFFSRVSDQNTSSL